MPSLDLVWDAWTKPEMLDQWWGPQPWRAQTKIMDFREGGYWLYCMIGPQEEKHWSRSDYKKIEIRKSFSAVSCFCDEDGIPNPDFSDSLWTNGFSENENTTTVSINIEYKSLEILEKIIEMGFKEGLTMAMEGLDKVFEGKK